MSPIRVREDEIVQEVMIKAPAERIFRALTRPEELLQWWASEGRFQVIEAPNLGHPDYALSIAVREAGCMMGECDE